MRPQRTEGGFTLPELLLAIVVLGIIISALGSAFVVLLSNYSAVGSRAAQSHDSQLLSSWLLPDVQSAGSSASNVDTNSGSAFPCGGSAAVLPSQNVLTMTWQDYDAPTGTPNNVVSYRREGSAAPYVLARYVCVVNQPATRNVVGHNVQSASAALTTNKIFITVTSIVGTSCVPATDCYTFTVSANRLTAVPPGNLAPAFTSQASVTESVGVNFNFVIAASGSPTPVISWTGTLPGGVSLTDNGDGTATMTGAPSLGGTFTLNLTATNGIGTPATQVFTLNVNQAPQITSANSATFTVGVAGSFTVTTSGYPLATMGESGALPTGVTFTAGAGTATISGTPAAGTAGSYTLTLTATNTWGSAVPQTFTLTVTQRPVFTSPSSTTFTVGAAGSFTVTALGPPAPTLSESGALPSGVTFTPATGVLAGTPANGTAGVYTITFTATNSVGSTPQTFTLTVNQSPRITSPPSYWAVVNTHFSFTVTATGLPAPTFSETGALPAGVTLTAGGVLSGTATTRGTYPITITASNGVAPNATQAFTLTIANATAPTITSPNSTTAGRNTAFSFMITTTGAPAPTLSVGVGVPSGVTFTNNGNGTATLSGSPTAANGTYTFTITASNGTLPNATQTFTLTIATAAAPAITSTNHVTSAHGVAMATFTVTTTGAPTPALTVSTVGAQTGLPAGTTFTDKGNGTATITGTPTTAGTYTFTITAANGVGANATQTFTFTVT